MIPDDRRRARSRSRAAERESKAQQIAVLIGGATALLLFLLV